MMRKIWNNKYFRLFAILLLSISLLCGCGADDVQISDVERTSLVEDGSYTSPEDVAEYLHFYGHLPDNFITKSEARTLGWDRQDGNLDEVAPGMSIGGDSFGNREGSTEWTANQIPTYRNTAKFGDIAKWEAGRNYEDVTTPLKYPMALIEDIDYSNSSDYFYAWNAASEVSEVSIANDTKSMFDPCPAGWRMPDGGANGVWSKALGAQSIDKYDSVTVNGGRNFSGIFGENSVIWYPAPSYISDNGSLNNDSHPSGKYWCGSTTSSFAHNMQFNIYGGSTSATSSLACGYSVRCQKE